MYTLYYSPGACSMAIHAALAETGADYKLVRVNLHGAGKDAALLKVNPRHQVPVLDDDGMVIREGAAILIHVLEKENSPLLPKSGRERAAALEWLCFANATLHPKYSLGFGYKRMSDDTAVQDAAAAFACAGIQKAWDDVETHLAGNRYLAGDQVSVGDILICVIANWNGKMPRPIILGPNTQRLIRDVSARPGFQKALQEEQVEYKAAA